ncbi:MAG: DUF2339 domain-containing protein [Fluviicola sp.]|nr:DUF2339 domain-containing protein [Fluviicola sp.]
MSTDNERIRQLEESYRKLWEQHLELKESIRVNYAEFKDIRDRMGIPEAESAPQATPEPVIAPNSREIPPTASPSPVPEKKGWPEDPVKTVKPAAPKEKSTWEEYIGEQLLSKIGIVILIIGVGIGAKYAIDHQLLSPAMRILGGYGIAAVLGLFAYRFKGKYTAFSAVLASGALAVTYFMTYAAYVFYGLYPYWLAFTLLFLTTGATVVSALRYNMVIIAHIGLVGAYVLPVLISNQSNHISSYLIYMAVINGGILAVSFLRDWKSLFHVAFGWTVCVFIAWFVFTYSEKSDANTALFFLTLFFGLFQTAFIAYPLMKKQQFKAHDLWLVIPNMLGYFIMGQFVLHWGNFHPKADFIFGLLIGGLFFVLWLVFRKLRSEDRLLQDTHFMVGSAAITLSLLLELEGASLPLFLAIQAVLMGWLNVRSARQTKDNWRFPDVFSTILIALSLFVLLFKTTVGADHSLTIAPFSNDNFWLLLATVFVTGVGFVIVHNTAKSVPEQRFSIIDGLLIATLFGGFFVGANEIYFAFRHAYSIHKIPTEIGNEQAWNATLLMAITAFIGVYWCLFVFTERLFLHLKNGTQVIPFFSGVLIALLLIVMTLISTKYGASEYLTDNLEWVQTLSRYAVFCSILGMGWTWLKAGQKNQQLLTVIHIAILWMLSLEMTHWLSVNTNDSARKLSLSILWGIYAIYILYLGIIKAFPALRVTAMIILGITLVKLFLYDISHLSTPAKTILFIALGGLLLLGAYFYQRNSVKNKPNEVDLTSKNTHHETDEN